MLFQYTVLRQVYEVRNWLLWYIYGGSHCAELTSGFKDSGTDVTRDSGMTIRHLSFIVAILQDLYGKVTIVFQSSFNK